MESSGPAESLPRKVVSLTEQPNEVELVQTATEMRQLANVWHYNPDLDFRKLALEAEYGSKGFRLIEDKDDLINVPHIIIGVTYRPGFPQPGGKVGDYVSIEAVVADKETLNTPPIRRALPAELAVYGNEPIVYNDGSTGIRRQLTEEFHAMGLIDVGSPRKDENPFDRPYTEWVKGGDLAETGIVADANGIPFRYVAVRGLRRSDYEWQGQPAHTHYIG